MKIKSFFLTASLLLLLPFCAIAQDQHLGIEIGYNRPVLREAASWDGGKLTTPFNGARVGLMPHRQMAERIILHHLSADPQTTQNAEHRYSR